jgi:hypothetical protein
VDSTFVVTGWNTATGSIITATVKAASALEAKARAQAEGLRFVVVAVDDERPSEAPGRRAGEDGSR